MLLYIMLAYIMLFAALSNAACLHNAFFSLTFANDFCFHTLSWGIDTAFLFKILFCIMHSAFNPLAYLIFFNTVF